MDQAAGEARGRGRPAAFGFIFATALMNSISFGIMIPILPNLIKSMLHGDTAAASEWNVVFTTVWGVMQFFIGPMLGMLSDRFGRRPVLLISIFGLMADFLVMAWAPNVAWLFVGRALSGATAASFSTGNAYVADIAPPERRARLFGIMGSAFGFGFVIGPTIGGLLGEHNLRLPFLAAAGLCLANGLYGLFILPESLPRERRAPTMHWPKANPLGALSFLAEQRRLLGLGLVGFIYQLGFNVLPAVFVLYTGYRYGWTPKILGFTFLATGLCQIAVQMFLVGPVVRRIGERGAVVLGLSGGAVGFLVYALAASGPLYQIGIPIFALTGFTSPGLLGLMSRRVGVQRQGQLQGANQSLQGIASILGPPLFGLTFAYAVRHDAALHLPGLPIFIAAALLLAALGLFLAAMRASPGAAAP